ncbi:SAV_2336 N-terminal domain-related protein [Streptomyces durhamensis]|uniref:SAV_2336 N-terminal domain-related protein n=1 Tax=Streptomyces durhamensis TaxID=68194 RepID=UPI00068B5CDA|nr:SAV_2336 N-terminal domain-related protein [Streptomyces durhamensis]
MPSDGPRRRDPLTRLTDALAGAAGGVRPTPLQMAELLWLARQMEPVVDGGPVTTAPPPAGPGAAPPLPEPPGPPAREPHHPPPPDPAPARTGAGETPRAPLHLPAPVPGTPGAYAGLLAPAPPMLRHPLGLQRALRPLKRHTDAPSGHRLDEHATADRIARLGASPEWWLPVLRPARERWLRLNLAYDTGPTMPVWRPLIRELHTAVAQSGVFRTVSPLRVTAEGTVHGDGTHAPADGRTVTLVISDCMGPQWRPGPAGSRWEATLRRWCRRMPVAVVQPLPEHLWRDTALPVEPGLLTAPFPAAPAAALAFAPYDGDPARFTARGLIPLPVLEAGPRWLANWAALLASAGGSGFPGSAAALGGRPDPGTRTDLGRLSAEELVLRFRGTSSPEAVRLAAHLAVGRPDLPVMRLVQRAVEPDPRPQHLAEVILSGLLTTAPGPAGSYAFRPGVRELLLRGLPRSSRSRTTDLLARAGALIEDRAGAAPGEFHAVAPVADGSGGAAPDGEPFATVRRESVRRLAGGGAPSVPPGLAGRYRLLRRMSPSGSLWLAGEPAADRTVVLRLHEPVTDRTWRADFLRQTRALKALDHPNVVTVHDFGIEDDIPYVVMEHLDGIPLNTLAAPNGYHLPAPLTVSLGAQLARALLAAHAQWIRHGAVGMSRVVLLPDGTVRLTLFEPVLPSDLPRDEDLRALGEMMLHLAAGSARAGAAPTLRHLPEPVRRPYAEALSLLRSTPHRSAGVPALLDDQLLDRAREAYRPRSYVLLGPVSVDVAGRSPQFPPAARALLAMLLLRHGRKVTHDELRAGLWSPAEEPEDATAALGRLASALRAALGPGALATLPDGYALHTSADHVDLLRCEELRRLATELSDRGDPRAARERLDEALALWGGAGPLAGVPGPAARTARTRLLQLQLALQRERAELDLESGEFERAAADLTTLLRAHPAREDYRRLLLLALQRLGRTEAALEVFEEYAESGGDDPVLLALGHELRGDLADDAAPGDAEQPPEYDPDPGRGSTEGPDGLPLGSFPTEDDLPSLLYGPEDTAAEAPLPQDDVPDSLFAAEDASEASEASDALPSDPSLRPVARFELADGPGDADDRPALGRAVVRLLLAAELGPDDYELRTEWNGYALRPRTAAAELALLCVTLRELRDRLAETGGLRWRVTFERPRDGHRRAGTGPGAELLDRVRDAAGALGVVAVPDALRTELVRGGVVAAFDPPRTVIRGDQALPRLLPLTPHTPADGWYALAHAPAPDAVEPVQGPFRLPGEVPLPRPAGRTRAVVFTAYGPGFTLNRPSGDTYYYEVDLTERRLEVTELGPVVNGVPVFTLTGEASWRITDPLRAVSAASGRVPSVLVTERLRDCLGMVSPLYPPRRTAEAHARLEAELRAHPPSGYAVDWRGSLTPTRGSLAAPPPGEVDGELAGALRAADAVLLGFDGVLTRLRGDDGSSLPLDLLRERAGEVSAGELAGYLRTRETAAARAAQPVANADLLVRTLDARGLRLAVVTDHATEAVTGYLEQRGLMGCLPGGVHGRDDLGHPLMPHPHRVLQAVARLGVRPEQCLMVGTGDAEQEAARAARVPFVHVDPGFRRAADVLTSHGLLPLLRAAQSV